MTLEELKAKRKEIDEQIRAMQNKAVTCGRAKLDKDHYATDRPDEYCIAVKRNTTDTGTREAWYSVIRSTDKAVAVGVLPEMIRDLQGLYEMLKGEK